MLSIILLVLRLIIYAVIIIKIIRDIRHHNNYTIPQQLVHLVQQAHTGRPSQTLWDIEVSDEMKIALRAPLTPQQIEVLSQLSGEVINAFVTGYVLSHKSKDGELTGVVCVSIDISSSAGTYKYKYSEVKLRITIRRVGKPLVSSKWVVSSVEQIL